MAKEHGEPRTWPYVIALVLLCAGAFGGRRVEVSQRSAARLAEATLSFELEGELAAQLDLVRGCVSAGACADPNGLGFPPGDLHDGSRGNESWWLLLVDHFSPELHQYVLLNFEWNAIVREATLADGTVTDQASLTTLLDGPLPTQLTDELARSRDASADTRDLGRLLSRVFGWGWKLCLIAIFVLPIGASVFTSRRQRRMLDAQWRDRQHNANTPPLIPIGPAES